MIRVVLSTFPDEDVAAGAVRALVGENLAACGTIVPGARSIYRWQGRIEDAREVIVFFKIAAADFERFRARLATLHPYEVPEILAISPSEWHAAYAEWVVFPLKSGSSGDTD